MDFVLYLISGLIDLFIHTGNMEDRPRQQYVVWGCRTLVVFLGMVALGVWLCFR